MKKFLLFYLTLSTIFLATNYVLLAQNQTISLTEAVNLARQNSIEYKVAVNSYQSSIWSYRNYLASFRPMLYLDGTIPNYSRAINKITLPNGEDTFVLQNQSYSTLNLGLRQNVALTGGEISISSSLNRIDVFGNDREIIYSAIPASISYVQNTVGYNSFKWQKKIEPLRFESADRGFITRMEEIAGQTVAYFFDLLAKQTSQELARENLARADTLHAIALERYNLGTVSQSELQQLKLNVLNARNRVMRDSVDAVLAQQRFARYLVLTDENERRLKMPRDVHFFKVGFNEALKHALVNGKQVTDNKLLHLEAEEGLAKAKAENSLKFNVRANFGLSNTAPRIPMLFNQLENQQNITIGFSVPILDWGLAKTERLRAQTYLAMVESQIEQNHTQLEQDIALQTARWALHQEQMAVSSETRDIAQQNYELEVERFLRGSITINDLNAAQGRKDEAATAYIEALRTYWELYYTLRKLTLYDFENGTTLIFEDRITTDWSEDINRSRM